MIKPVLFLFLISWTSPAWSAPPRPELIALNIPCTLGSRFPVFSLQTSASCRGALTAAGERICIPRDVLPSILSSSSPFCGKALGRWKLFSPLEQGPDSKRILRIFRMDRFLNGPPFLAHSWAVTLWMRIQRTRFELSETLRPWDPDCIFRALLLGEKDSDSPAEFLRLLGFVHLFSATGIHLYALATFIFWLTGNLALAARLPARIAIPSGRFGTLLLCSWAWILAGCRIGMLRPWVLILVRSLARSLGAGLRPSVLLPLAFGLDFGVAYLRGGALWDSGRVLSALSVGGSLLVAEKVDAQANPVLVHLAIGVGGWIFAAPWEAARTGTVSLATPILSLLSLPAICGIIYPWLEIESALRFLGLHTSLLNSPSGNFVLQSLDRSVWILTRLALDCRSLWILTPPWLVAGALIASSLVVLFKISLRYRAAILASLLLIRIGVDKREAFSKATKFLPATAREVIQLDVGQGDSALVLTKAGAGLIDAGSVRAVSDTQWIRLLARAQVDHLNWVLLTHLDEDHRGGLTRLTRLIPIDCVLISRQEFETERGIEFARKMLEHHVAVVDQSCTPFPVRMPPDSTVAAHKKTNANMSAIVIPLVSGDTYISAGDAENEDEVAIAQWADSKIRGAPNSTGKRIFKISHHGSDTSTDPRVLKILHPDLAVISAGVGNPYGHPSFQVLSRLENAQIPIRRTDRDGAIPITEADDHRRPREHRP